MKISVVVPVYNVEKYLSECLESIIAQSYKNLEIILVNDGSSDNSGNICDKYSEKDTRIRVIHKKNCGLSDARNTGIEYATGDYITFVDSDDFIDRQYIDILIKNMVTYNADISCCDYIRTTKRNYDFHIKKVGESTLLESEDGIKFYLKKEIVSAWGKVYKKEIFSILRFPSGKINEDISTIFKAFINAKKIVYINNKLYYYYQNNNGITKKKFNVKSLHLAEAWTEVVELSQYYNDEIKELAKLRLNKSYFSLLGVIAYYGIEETAGIKKQKEYLLHNFKQVYMKLLLSKNLALSRKIAIVCMRMSFSLCCMCGYFLRYLKGER